MVVSLVQWPAVKCLFNCRISGASTDSRYNVTRSFISIWHRRPSGPGIQKICLKSIPKSTWSSISFEILWSTHKWVHGRKDVLGKIFVSLCIFARNSFTTLFYVKWKSGFKERCKVDENWQCNGKCKITQKIR